MSALIDQYRRYYATHSVPVARSVWIPMVRCVALRVDATSIIDYGCGPAKGLSFLDSRELTVYSYDPAIPELSTKPEPRDMVCSIHMLEHVDPDDIADVINDMLSLSLKALLVVISLEASTKTLPDGSAWHRSVFPASYWHERFPGSTPVKTIKGTEREFACLLTVRQT